MKDFFLEDHLWTLKTWDKDGTPIVMVHYNRTHYLICFLISQKTELKLIDRYEIGANTKA